MHSDADFRAMALQKAIEAMPGHSFKTILEAAEAFYEFLVKDRDDDGPEGPEDLVDHMSGSSREPRRAMRSLTDEQLRELAAGRPVLMEYL